MRLLLVGCFLVAAQAACPYSAMWMKYGPARASEMIKAHHGKRSSLRRLMAEDPGLGSCEYQGFMGPDCKQFVGSSWDEDKATKACSGEFKKGGRCQFYSEDSLAGYCVTGAADSTEVTGALIGGMVSSCSVAEMGCTTFGGGSFIKAGQCSEGKTTKNTKATPSKDMPTDLPTAGPGATMPTDLPTSGPAPPTGAGMCQYTSPFAGPGCQQYTGAGWTEETAKADCDKAMGGMAKGTLTPSQFCPEAQDEKFAGYCYTNKGKPEEFASLLALSPGMMGDCKSAADACTTWSAGTFAPAGACAEAAANGMVLTGEVETCAMGPGPMGGGHMDGRSPGYTENCEGTPAAGSKYQWPLRWSALTNSTSLPADPFDKNGKRKPLWSSYSKVWYDLSKNYKRMDMLAREGRSQFDYSGDDPNLDKTIMVHRGREMIFVNNYKNGSKSCRSLDMSVIGNIRPDWFLDGRGQGSSSQYMGNQHIYYLNEPTLVKQWRKKDFASMYFVVSMAAEADENGVHWPLIMDVPGEGFGEDAITIYWDHQQLPETTDDDDLFFPDKGMTCEQDMSQSQGPTGEEIQEMNQNIIPSNLNVGEAGWVALEWTGAPGKDVPSLNDLQVRSLLSGESSNCQGKAAGGGQFKTLSLGDYGEMKACMSEDNELTVKVSHLSESAVWAGVGFRPASTTAESRCTMLPATAVIGQADGEDYEFRMGELPKNLQNFGSDGVTVFNSFEPVPEDFSGVAAAYIDGKTTFEFTRQMENPSPSIFLTWAAGSVGQVSYHGARGCITLQDLPTCANNKPTEMPTETATDRPTETATDRPTESAIEKPTESATEKPTESATEKPTEDATDRPTAIATEIPTPESEGQSGESGSGERGSGETGSVEFGSSEQAVFRGLD